MPHSVYTGRAKSRTVRSPRRQGGTLYLRKAIRAPACIALAELDRLLSDRSQRLQPLLGERLAKPGAFAYARRSGRLISQIANRL